MNLLKVYNKTTQVFTVVASLAALVLFFLTFATVSSNGQEISIAGSQLAWKGDIEFNNKTVEIARSTDIWFCFILTVLGVLFSALTFKFKGMRYAAPAVTLAAGIYMLVISCSNPTSFVDVRPLDKVFGITVEGQIAIWKSIEYGFAVWGATIALLASAVFGITHLLLDDYIFVKSSKSAKYTIPKRLVRFFKDYKSEVKKIVWPTGKTVFKNTLIVLTICLILGAFIWLVDFGLAELLKLVFVKEAA